MTHEGAARRTIVVRGRVVDRGGLAVDGVELNLYVVDPAKPSARTWTRRTTSRRDGSFEFSGGNDDRARLRLDASPRPDQALRATQIEDVGDEDVVVVLQPGAGVVARVVDAFGAPLGGEKWRLWLDSTLPGWPPRDRREEYEARLAALDDDGPEFEKFAALPESAGGAVPDDGRVAFAGLERGAYWVQLSRVDPDRRRWTPCVVTVEGGDAEIVDGALVLNGAATIVVRASSAA
jgi:hypothetical protein